MSSKKTTTKTTTQTNKTNSKKKLPKPAIKLPSTKPYKTKSNPQTPRSIEFKQSNNYKQEKFKYVDSSTREQTRHSASKPYITTTNNGTRVSHKEYLGEIESSTTFIKRMRMEINAGMPLTFPLLSEMANNYTRARYNKVIFHFESLTGNVTVDKPVGEILVLPLYDYDSLDEFNSKQSVLNTEGAVSYPCTKNFSVSLLGRGSKKPVLSRDTDYLIRGKPVSDHTVYDIGYFDVYVTGFHTSNVNIGNVWIEYDIELFQLRQKSSEAGDYKNLSVVGGSNANFIMLNGPLAGNVYDWGMTKLYSAFYADAYYVAKPDTYTAFIRLQVNSGAVNFGGQTFLDYTYSGANGYAKYRISTDGDGNGNGLPIFKEGGVYRRTKSFAEGTVFIMWETFSVEGEGYLKIRKPAFSVTDSGNLVSISYQCYPVSDDTVTTYKIPLGTIDNRNENDSNTAVTKVKATNFEKFEMISQQLSKIDVTELQNYRDFMKSKNTSSSSSSTTSSSSTSTTTSTSNDEDDSPDYEDYVSWKAKINSKI